MDRSAGGRYLEYGVDNAGLYCTLRNVWQATHEAETTINTVAMSRNTCFQTWPIHPSMSGHMIDHRRACSPSNAASLLYSVRPQAALSFCHGFWQIHDISCHHAPTCCAAVMLQCPCNSCTDIGKCCKDGRDG